MKNLALKYRPKNLDDLLGQEGISVTLKNSILENKISHSYIFYGPRGCGKTSTARILAKTLNCKKRNKYNPCDECESCIEISKSSSIDVMEIDAASNTSVEDVRKVIIDNINITPTRDKYKIYILDEVHMLSNSAFNALLKTIEEPPDHVVFIMATTEINKVPATIISRCQTFRFKPINEEVMLNRLKEIINKEEIKAEDNALKLIVSASQGAMRDALTILDRAISFSKSNLTYSLILQMLGLPPKEIIENLTLSLINKDSILLNTTFKKMNEEGYEPFLVLKELRNFLSLCFLEASNFSKTRENENIIKDLNPYIFAKLARKLNVILDEIKFSDNISLIAEVSLHTILEIPIDIESLIKKVEGLNINVSVKKDFVEKKNNLIKKEDEVKSEIKIQKESNPSIIWSKMLEKINEIDIALYNFLSSSSIFFPSPNEWTIHLDSDYQKIFVSNRIEIINKEISSFSNFPIKINLGIKKKKEVIEDISIVKEEEKKEESPSNRVWEDVNNNNEESFPELEKFNKMIKGNIKKIYKINK